MKLKVAILGAGRNGSYFVEQYKDNPHPFEAESQSMIQSIVEDKPVPVTLAEGANAAIGAIAAEDSARLEQTIQVPFYR